MRRAERGMTLLEVMAAVAILGLLYTYLATAATQGVQSEASSRRRMEASLLADEALAEIEMELATGAAPPTATREHFLGDFFVVIEPTPFELPAELAEAWPADSLGAPSLFGRGTRAPSLVTRISIRVMWHEGLARRFVDRVTFALDQSAVGALTGDFATPTGRGR